MLSFAVSADQNSRRPALQNPSRKVCASNPSLFKRCRTLARNGALATPLQSIVSALFPMQQRGYPFISTHSRPPSTFYKFFRITTCKSGSKQTTLSTFKINTYEKTGGGGGSFFFPYFVTSLLPCFILRCPFGVYRRPNDPHLIRRGDHFKPAALQRAHFHHLMNKSVQHSGIDKLCVRSRNEESPRPFHMNTCRSGRRQRTVAQHDKLRAPRISRARIFKHFFRLQIQEAHAHRPTAEDSFQMPSSTASAEILFRVERNHRVSALPHSFARWIAPKPYAVSQRPHTRELVQFALRCRDSRGHGVGVVEHAHGNSRGFPAQRRGQCRLQRESLHLLQVGRFFHDPAADNSRKPDPDGFDLFLPRNLFHLSPDAVRNPIRWHRLQR